MGRSALPPLRSLPRVFLPGVDPEGPISLPGAEIDKFRKVLRLRTGDYVAVLPGDGRLIVATFENQEVHPVEIVTPATEAARPVTLAQALPKADRIDDIVRSCTEVGVSRILLFSGERSVVRWEGAKLDDRLRRLGIIAREAAEQSFRVRLPRVDFAPSLAAVLDEHPEAIVFSEVEGERRTLSQVLPSPPQPVTLVIGPEGGWAPREIARIGDRGVTLGPRVLRVDTAAIAASALVLLNDEVELRE